VRSGHVCICMCLCRLIRVSAGAQSCHMLLGVSLSIRVRPGMAGDGAMKQHVTRKGKDDMVDKGLEY
jgi:hypothetical protein